MVEAAQYSWVSQKPLNPTYSYGTTLTQQQYWADQIILRATL
jgi:hypothetical protein